MLFQNLRDIFFVISYVLASRVVVVLGGGGAAAEVCI